MPKKRPRSKHRSSPKSESLAIVPIKPPTAIVQTSPTLSAMPTIKSTVENMERVRRFMSMCLNTDLQKALEKATREKTKLSDAERERLEVDWGTIPGNDKPFLKQPGAEKFMFWLQVRPKYFTTTVDLGDGHLEVISHVVVYHKATKEEVFEGPDCSCTSMENNFRFIWADIEKENEPSKDRKEELKKIGMGRNRKKKVWDRGRIVGETWVWQERVDNPNIWNERNKVRQQGEKRALVKCVRNMGALSEIFTQPPDEWDIYPEDPDGSPETSEDYTPGGRQVINGEGFAPSGKPVTHEAKAKAEVMEEVERQKKETKSKPIEPEVEDDRLRIEYVYDEAGNIVRGDLAEIIEIMQKHCTSMRWDGSWWRISPKDFNTLVAICKHYNYRLIEIDEKPKPPKPQAPKSSNAKRPEQKQKSADANDGPTLLIGTIQRVTAGMTSKNAPTRQVKIQGTWYTSYKNTIFDYLDKGVGMDAKLWIDARHQIVGLKQVGRMEFDQDGKTPVVQRKDQEAGSRTLFNQ